MASSQKYVDAIVYANAFDKWQANGHMLDPFHHGDFYSKSIVAADILDVSPPTMGKMLKQGIIYEPFHKKNASSNARGYYTITDLMRISIIHHGSIKMNLIYEALIHGYSGEQDEDSMRAHKELFFTRKNHGSALFHNDISSAFQIIKYQIVNNIDVPISLSPYLFSEEVQVES